MFLTDSEKLKREKGIAPYNMDDYSFLTKLNENLAALEASLVDPKYISEHPNIFILGLPRSGTTLISQVLFNHLDIGCTNNLIARFWDTPLAGTKLSRIVLGDTRSGSYNSVYASTEHITDPHEFAYFWRKHFLSFDVATSYPPERIKDIHWEEFRTIICNMNRIWGKAIMFKPLEIAGYYLEKFMEVFPRSIYVYIERDPTDTAISIANARLKLYGNLDDWFGTYPLEYGELKNETWWNQIAGQMFYLDKMYKSNTAKAGSRRIIHVQYEEFCANPPDTLNNIINKLNQNYSYKLKMLSEPVSLKVSKPSASEEIVSKLKTGLKKFNLITE